MEHPVVDALAAVPEIIAAVILTIVSIRAATPRRPVVIALIIGACAGAAVTLLLDRAFGF